MPASKEVIGQKKERTDKGEGLHLIVCIYVYMYICIYVHSFVVVEIYLLIKKSSLLHKQNYAASQVGREMDKNAI